MKPVTNLNELKMRKKNLKLQLQYQEEKLRQTTGDLVYTFKFMFTQAVIKNSLVSLISLIKKRKKKKKKKKQQKEDC